MSLNLRIGDSKVLESRESLDGSVIRRRRVSLDGQHRFTTYERVELPALMVLKRTGKKEIFDRDKLFGAVKKSVGKFFKTDEEVESVVNKVVEEIYGTGEHEVPSSLIGEKILEVLAKENEVAYVRFASVFREFKTLEEFEAIIREQKLKNAQERGCA